MNHINIGHCPRCGGVAFSETYYDFESTAHKLVCPTCSPKPAPDGGGETPADAKDAVNPLISAVQTAERLLTWEHELNQMATRLKRRGVVLDPEAPLPLQERQLLLTAFDLLGVPENARPELIRRWDRAFVREEDIKDGEDDCADLYLEVYMCETLPEVLLARPWEKQNA